MPYTLHLNVDYADNHTDWVHFQTETGEGIGQRWREFGPFETIAERAEALHAMARRALDVEGVPMRLFD